MAHSPNSSQEYLRQACVRREVRTPTSRWRQPGDDRESQVLDCRLPERGGGEGPKLPEGPEAEAAIAKAKEVLASLSEDFSFISLPSSQRRSRSLLARVAEN